MMKHHSANKTGDIGVFHCKRHRSRIRPLSRGINRLELRVSKGEAKGVRHGDVVEYSFDPSKPRRVQIIKNLGPASELKSLSEIAVRSHHLTEAFPDAALEEANRSCERTSQLPREDLRSLDFVTIDPEDARDHDDAVVVSPDGNSDGGYVIWVAIADVAHFVRPGGALCEEARRRGNSTYLPDMVLPMLPVILSGDACSLHEGKDRFCLAVKIIVDHQGNKVSHKFVRGVMRSRASLTYHQAQAIIGGDQRSNLRSTLLRLQDAHQALQQERSHRQPLDLDLQERKVRLSENGKVTDIVVAERLECHQIIEDFMILANVCAAETLSQCRIPHLSRIHADPETGRVDELSGMAKRYGVNLSSHDRVNAASFNRLLTAAAQRGHSEFMGTQILRAMQQAVYSPVSDQHFGLSLRRYVHFTSPIRRYADLMTHRALIQSLELGSDERSDDEPADLKELAKHLSATERRSTAAERESRDRFTASYLSERISEVFAATIMSVLSFGLFVRIDDLGAEGLVPVRSIGREYFAYNAKDQSLSGERSGRKICVGQRVKVRLREVDLATGQLSFRLYKPQTSGNSGIGNRYA